MLLRSALTTASGLVVACCFSQNTTIISNFHVAKDENRTEIHNQSSKAMGFTMGGLPMELTEVQLNLSFNSLPSVTIVDAAIYSNNASNNPGTKLAQLESIISGAQTEPSNVVVLRPDVKPFRTFRLQPNTTYWLVVRSHGSSVVHWAGTTPNTAPIGIATHFGARFGNHPPTEISAFNNSYTLKGVFRASSAWYLQDPATGQIGVASIGSMHFTNWRTFPQVVGSAWEVLSFGNYGESSHADAFLRNKTTGQLAFWFANSNNFFKFVTIPQTPPAVWQFHGTARFNSAALFPVYQNPQSGVVIVGAHNGSQITQWRIFPKVPNPAWEIVAVGDFNADDFGDVMFRNKATGQLAVWRTNGFDFTTWHVFPQVPSSAWKIVAFHDFPTAERGVLFQSVATGEYAVWLINAAGTAFTNWMTIRPQPDPKFQYKGYGFIELPF